MKNKNLKQAMFTSPQSGDKQFPMYVIENEEDLLKFENAIDTHSTQKINFREHLKEGKIIILNDPHRLTGYPTYCFQADKEDTHPSSFHRVN